MGSKLRLNQVYASAAWLSENYAILSLNTPAVEVNDNELKKISRHASPKNVVMLVHIPAYVPPAGAFDGKLTLLLETVQDPGNLGTIIRIADWYGIEHIICSPDTADTWNPKTIDAAMGSIARVHVIHMPPAVFLEQHPDLPVYGAMLNGESIYSATLSKAAVVIIGNEGRGISAGLARQVQHPVAIPRVGGAESLNAAIATAIICDHFANRSGAHS